MRRSGRSRSARARRARALIVLVSAAVLLVVSVSRWLLQEPGLRPPSGEPAASGQRDATSGGADVARIEELFASRRSGEFVEVRGDVVRLLADDERGSRHQRFIVRLRNGMTMLVAHNIDLAERAPVDPGDPVTIRGMYEWNEQGGVIHWTHRDPTGRQEGGFVLHDAERYD